MIRRKLLKKVAYFSVNSFVGGAEMATLNYCIYHKKEGRWAPILIVLEQGELTLQAKENNIPVVELGIKVRMSRPLSIIRAALKLRRELKRHGVSLIHASMGYAHIISSLACIRTGVERAWYQHGPVGTIFDRIASLFKSSLTFYNSKYLLDLAQKVPSIFDHRNYIIEPIVEERGYRSPQKEVLNFAHIGRISPFKNIEGIIKSFAKLSNKDIFLNLYGDANSQKDKHYKQTIEKLISELGLTNRVFFHGHVVNISEVLNDNDCLIHSALEFEPFGLTIAEAFYAGMPTICSELSGASLDFDSGVECLKHSNDHELFLRMNDFISLSYEERVEMGQKAKEKASRFFAASKIINKIEKLYDEAI